MKSAISRKLPTTGALAFAAAQSILIQAQTAAPFPGYINEYLRTNYPSAKAWDIGGDDRIRFESRHGMAVAGQAGSVDFRRSGADVNNDYLLNRFRLHLGYNDKWWNIYTEVQSSAAFSDERYAYPNSPAVAGTIRRKGSGPESDTIDLHQAHLSVGNLKEFPISMKIGRQELIYGDERLVGASGWNNIARTFDAIKIRYQNDWVGADLFTSHVVIPEDSRFDVSNSRELFSGINASFTKVPHHSLDVYFLARNASPEAIHEEPSPQFVQPTARDIYTAGGRVKSKAGELGSFDYALEGAFQFGRFAPSAVTPALDQNAFMFVAQAGYTFTNAWAKPRLGIEYAFGSGDDNPTDNSHGTFENLFPTNHKFYGFMDAISLQNIHDIRPSLQLKPSPRSSITLEGHAFLLADTRDFFYNVGGAPRTAGGYGINPAYDSFVGSELDLVGTYSVSRSTTIEAGYGHFFTGRYVQSSLAAVGGEIDANWFYLQLLIKF